jgi:hypothetical protein
MLYKGLAALFLGILFIGCATHRIAAISWEGEKVRLQVTPPGGSTLFSSPALQCLTCDEVIPTFAVNFDDAGKTTFYLAEANERVVHRFHLEASGVDTALLLQQPPPKEAEKRYGLSKPLVGRIRALQYVLIYRDSAMDHPVGAMERQDEANIFGEDDIFYYIHHPKYKQPCVLLKSHAMRIE